MQVVHRLEHPEQDRGRLRREGRSRGSEPGVCRRRGRDLVFPVICFKDWRAANGTDVLHRLGGSDASMILFSQVLGLMLGEWKGTSKKTMVLLTAGLCC